MQFLFVTTQYPNGCQPTRATYNRSLVRALTELGHEVRVIAPVPWCPIIDPLLRHRRLPPLEEEIDGTRVQHPRFLYTPGLFVRQRHLQYRRGVEPVVRSVLRKNPPDHVFLGFAYPDAAALAPLCRDMRVSWSVMVLGSDFRIRTRQPGFQEIVLNTLRDAPLIFCPGQALRRDMTAAGIQGEKIVAFRNGVERGIFHP